MERTRLESIIRQTIIRHEHNFNDQRVVEREQLVEILTDAIEEQIKREADASFAKATETLEAAGIEPRPEPIDEAERQEALRHHDDRWHNER